MNLTISIDGMHCDGCASAVKEAIGRLPGVTSVEVRLGGAVAKFDEATVGNAEIIDAIRAAGPFEITGFSTS